MPIRIFTSGGGGIASGDIANAITFAKDNGADILSNSWGYSSDNPNLFPVIVAAIQDAVSTGRGGLGCVVVFAAGNTANHVTNNNGYVNFPANVNISGVFTVGASDRNDSQANYSPTSSIVEISAPSHKAYPNQISGETFEVWSIDIPGSNGYNPWNDSSTNPPTFGEQLPNTGTNFLDFTGRFGGTSAACPQVAAVAALLLSVRPDLTQQQIFNTITSTTDKVGGYSYVNGRSNELGYGRLNAFEAVKAVLPQIQGPSQFCDTETFTIPNLPSGATVSWTASGSIAISGSTTANPVMVSKVYDGLGSLTATINSACGNISVTKSNISASYPTPIIYGNSVVAPYNGETYYVDGLEGATDYQ